MKESKPFSFGAKPAATQPALSFGAKPDSGDKTVSFGANTEKSDKPTLSFGKSAETKAPVAAPGTEKKDAPAFSFGAKPAEKKDDSAPALSFGGDKKDSKPSGFSFGAKPAEKKEEAPSGFSFGAKPAEKKDDPPAGANTGTAASQTSCDKKEVKTDSKDAPIMKPTQIEPIPVSLDNKTMDDLIVKWSKQLTKTTGIFETYTSKVQVWDQQLATSADEIARLHRDASEVETLQQKIDQQLMFVETQQDELDKILDNYEQQADLLLTNIDLNNADYSSGSQVNANSNTTGLNVTDKLREKAYHNAELLDERLDGLEDNLSTLVEEINSVSDVFNKSVLRIEGAEPIEEIVKLLNVHLENLKYIESTKDVLEEKVAQLKNPKRR